MALDSTLKASLYEIESKIREYREQETLSTSTTATVEQKVEAQKKMDSLGIVIPGLVSVINTKIVSSNTAPVVTSSPIAMSDNTGKMLDYMKNISGGLELANKILPNINNPDKLMDSVLDIFSQTGWGINISIPKGSTNKEITLIGANDVIKLTKSFLGGKDRALKPEDILTGLVAKVEKEAFGFSIVELAKDFEKMQLDFNSGMLSQKDAIGSVMNKMGGMLSAVGMPPEALQQLNSFMKMSQGMLEVINNVQTAFNKETKSLADKIKSESKDTTSPEETTTTTTTSTTDTTATETTVDGTTPETTTPNIPAPSDEGATGEIKSGASEITTEYESEYNPYESETEKDPYSDYEDY